jgi:hypothetical protein
MVSCNVRQWEGTLMGPEMEQGMGEERKNGGVARGLGTIFVDDRSSR